MATVRLKYVNGFRDRHGKLRHYIRLPGRKAIPLPGLPGSTEFMNAYQAAIAGVEPPEIGKGKHNAGTVAAVVRDYLATAAFDKLAPDTKRARRKALERFAAEHGTKRIALLERRHVTSFVVEKWSTPGVARIFLSALSALMAFALETGIRDDNPCIGVKQPKLSREGWHTWSEDEIARFEAKHPIGTPSRLALALLLYSGQRTADVVRMGRQHIRNGFIEVRQQKTNSPLLIPIHPELRIALDAAPSGHLTFLTTAKGKPFSRDTFRHWFRARCKEAGLPNAGLTLHGLRKAICRRLAEAGCSASQIQSISGHKTLKEVERYTKAAEQALMARQAMGAITETQTYKPSEGFVKTGKKL